MQMQRHTRRLEILTANERSKSSVCILMFKKSVGRELQRLRAVERCEQVFSASGCADIRL